jgi:lipopolysaccharide/colanic/teichoic acid biosynthesis glycosyltransferase
MIMRDEINPITCRTKRALDVFFAATVLIATLPLLPFISLAIKLDSPGPVFFRQLRIGKAGSNHTVLFDMIKFRTMCVDAEAHGAVWASRSDDRITRVGRILRKTRLDELPQLLNVLRGEMSMIGPRPERPGFYQRLENEIPYFAERTVGVTPGITGLAQVSQGYDTCVDDVRTKLGYDLCYALALVNPRDWLAMDLHIALRTIGVMLGGRGQ